MMEGNTRESRGFDRKIEFSLEFVYLTTFGVRVRCQDKNFQIWNWPRFTGNIFGNGEQDNRMKSEGREPRERGHGNLYLTGTI